MSRTLKVLQVLRLYDEQHPVLRAGDIAGGLGVSLATAYRCIEDLESAGLLECIASGLYGLKVICVHSVAGSSAPPVVGYERGRAMPLHRGAPSRAILAHVPAPTLQRLVDENAAELRSAGWPTRLPELQQQLQAMRGQGVLVSVAEVDEGAHGWAVPVFAGRQLIGSLSVVRAGAGIAPGEHGRIGEPLRRAALRIEARLEDVK